jgi:hypothetical protein
MEFLKKKKSKDKESKIPRGMFIFLQTNLLWLTDILIIMVLSATIANRLVAKPWENFGRLGNYYNTFFQQILL